MTPITERLCPWCAGYRLVQLGHACPQCRHRLMRIDPDGVAIWAHPLNPKGPHADRQAT